jgi:hypothetical protein
MTYRIIRMRFNEPNEDTGIRGLTLEEAQAHCNDPETKGDGWFDAYTKENPDDDTEE